MVAVEWIDDKALHHPADTFSGRWKRADGPDPWCKGRVESIVEGEIGVRRPFPDRSPSTDGSRLSNVNEIGEWGPNLRSP